MKNRVERKKGPPMDSFTQFLEQKLSVLAPERAVEVSNYISVLETKIDSTNQLIERQFKRASQLIFAYVSPTKTAQLFHKRLPPQGSNSKEQLALDVGMEEAGVLWNLQGVPDIREDFQFLLVEESKKEAALRQSRKVQIPRGSKAKRKGNTRLEHPAKNKSKHTSRGIHRRFNDTDSEEEEDWEHGRNQQSESQQGSQEESQSRNQVVEKRKKLEGENSPDIEAYLRMEKTKATFILMIKPQEGRSQLKMQSPNK